MLRPQAWWFPTIFRASPTRRHSRSHQLHSMKSRLIRLLKGPGGVIAQPKMHTFQGYYSNNKRGLFQVPFIPYSTWLTLHQHHVASMRQGSDQGIRGTRGASKLLPLPNLLRKEDPSNGWLCPSSGGAYKVGCPQSPGYAENFVKSPDIPSAWASGHAAWYQLQSPDTIWRSTCPFRSQGCRCSDGLQSSWKPPQSSHPSG